MKLSNEHFSYLLSFLSNLEFSKDKEAIDKSIKSGAVITIGAKEEVLLKEIVSEYDDLAFNISDEHPLYSNFKNLHDLSHKENLSLYWGNVSFQYEGNRYFLFLKELNLKKGIGEQLKVSSKTVFPQLNGIPLKNYPVAPQKFRDFKSLLERTNVSPFDNESYVTLLQGFKGLFSPNDSSQVRLSGLDLDSQKGFFLAQSNSFNLFLNLVF